MMKVSEQCVSADSEVVRGHTRSELAVTSYPPYCTHTAAAAVLGLLRDGLGGSCLQSGGRDPGTAAGGPGLGLRIP